MKPQRIQLSRRPGASLQARSIALNSLPAINVARPSKWGNPWVIERFSTVCATAAQAVALFEKHELPRLADAAKRELRGKNLACWCPLDQPCHADVLLRIANQ